MVVKFDNVSEARLMISTLKTLEALDCPMLLDPAFSAFYNALDRFYLTDSQRAVMEAAEGLSVNNMVLAALIDIDPEYAAFAYG